MTTESNSQIFTDTVYGIGTDATSADLTDKERTTQEDWLMLGNTLLLMVHSSYLNSI